MINKVTFLWGISIVCIINVVRYYSSLRALLAIMKGCDPLLYLYVDGRGFFTINGQPSKQWRLVSYLLNQRYLEHHNDEFILRCCRVREHFCLTSALLGLMLISWLAM